MRLWDQHHTRERRLPLPAARYTTTFRRDAARKAAPPWRAGVSWHRLPGQALRQWTSVASELGGDMVAGTRAVLTSQPLRLVRITAVERLQDRLMLVPHRTAQADGLQHRPHGATDMGPVMVGGLGNERIARGRVDQMVKLHVHIDHRPDALPRSSPTPLEKNRGVQLGISLRGTARGEAVEDGPHLVHLGDRVRLDRRHSQAAPPGVADKTLLLEQTQ